MISVKTSDGTRQLHTVYTTETGW